MYNRRGLALILTEVMKMTDETRGTAAGAGTVHPLVERLDNCNGICSEQSDSADQNMHQPESVPLALL